MKKILMALILSSLAAGAAAADSYGYLVFWQNPNDAGDNIQIKTTKEDSSQVDAHAEMQAYCRAQDSLAGLGAGTQKSGCKFVMPLHNTCVAAAFPKAENKLSTDNAVIVASPRFKSVHQLALNQCAKKYGTTGQCGLETVYCTAKDYYEGTLKTLWNRLK